MYIQGIYMETADVYGHYTGPNSPELNAKLVAMDGVIGQLMDNLTSEGLADDVAVMIFSDHGMTEISPARSVNLTGENITYLRGCRGRDRMVVGFTTTCAISAYHH